MMKYLTRRIVLLTALYVCIIFGIFALQFTSGNAFSVTLGSIRVSCTMDTSVDGRSRPVLPIHIGANGLDFFLTEQNPLMAYASDSSGAPLKVTGLTQNANGFEIDFTDNVNVSFSSEKRGDVDIVTIVARIPQKYQNVAFPYKITRSAKLEKQGSLILVNTGKQQYAFSGATINPDAGKASHSLLIQRSSPVVYYQSWIPAKGLSLDSLASLPGSSEADYGRAVELYSSKALLAFKESVAAGNLSEPLVAAYIAEMGRIGMYQAAIESLPETWRNDPSRTWQTNTFLDHLERTYAGYITKEHEDRSMISRKLTDNNPEVFEFPSLVPYLVDRGSTILIKDIFRLSASLDMTSITARQAAGILEAMMDYQAYAPEDQNALLALADSCERKLKSSFVLIGNNLYLSDNGKTVNTLDTLGTAAILVKYGAWADGNSNWTVAGHLLVTSLAANSSDKGAVAPQFAFTSSEGQDAKTGITAGSEKPLDAATVYPALVISNTWYPHCVSLANQAGAGIWAWTSAQSIKVSKSADGVMKVTTRFPQGETHYMVLNGIKRFYRISIYGIDFHTDPHFESYNSSGYRYNEETNTLYLKMRHKSEYEDVIIYTGDDPVKPSSAPASPASGGTTPVTAAPAEGSAAGQF
jgi:hypothetical protein